MMRLYKAKRMNKTPETIENALLAVELNICKSSKQTRCNCGNFKIKYTGKTEG